MLRLLHKTPTSTPNVTFPQLRRDDAPHLPDSSRKSTSRFKKVGIFFFCCLLENGWGNPVEMSCLATLTAGVVRKKSINNEYPARSYSGTLLFFGILLSFFHSFAQFPLLYKYARKKLESFVFQNSNVENLKNALRTQSFCTSFKLTEMTKQSWRSITYNEWTCLEKMTPLSVTKLITLCSERFLFGVKLKSGALKLVL